MFPSSAYIAPMKAPILVPPTESIGTPKQVFILLEREIIIINIINNNEINGTLPMEIKIFKLLIDRKIQNI